MELPVVGLVDDPAALDLDPIVVPVAGYTLDREEIVEEFKFRPVLPWGAAFAIFEEDGGSRESAVIGYLLKSLMPDERERWRDFIARDDVVIAQETIVELYRTLIETYNARPTIPLSASTGGGGKTKQTSQGASRARASRSSQSRARSHST